MKRKDILVILLISMMLTLIAGCAGPTVYFGSIDVNSTPTGAKVYINGVDTDMVTPIIFTKEVGSYTIKLDLSHYKIWEGTVVVNADQTTYINPGLSYADAETPISLQPGAAGKDAYVVSTHPTNNYDYSYAWVGNWGSEIERTYIQFDLNTIPTNARLISASLSLYQFSSVGSGSFTVGLYQVTSDWGESNITWNNQPTSSSEVEASCTVYTGSTVWKTWYNIGDLVKGWLDGSVTNYGMLLKAANELSINVKAAFRTSDYTTDTSKRPKLTINYYIP